MSDKYIVAVGDPWNGIDLHGTFDSHDDAVTYATEQHQGEAWGVCKVQMVPNKLERLLDEGQNRPHLTQSWPFGKPT